MPTRSDSNAGQTQDVTMAGNSDDNTTDWSIEDQDQSNDSMTECDSDFTLVGDDDDDFSSDDEETPGINLTEIQSLEAGVEPTIWYAGDDCLTLRP